MHRFRCLKRLLPLLPLVLLATFGPVRAQVRPMNLQEMVQAAGTIFIGTVTEARGAIERGEFVTVSSFKVEQTVKGTLPSTYVVRQYGGQVGDRGMIVPHIRYFRTGERVMVMLYPASSIGFTNPVGLNQGIWSITSNGSIAGVTDQALNGLAWLVRKYRLSTADVQTVSRSSFIGMVRDLMAGSGGGR